MRKTETERDSENGICYCLFLASLERQEQTASSCQPRLGSGPAPCRRPRKRRPIYKVAPLSVSSIRRSGLSTVGESPLIVTPAESGKREDDDKDQNSNIPNSHPLSSEVLLQPPHKNSVTVNNTHSSLQFSNQRREPHATEEQVICMLFYMYHVYVVFYSLIQTTNSLIQFNMHVKNPKNNI